MYSFYYEIRGFRAIDDDLSDFMTAPPRVGAAIPASSRFARPRHLARGPVRPDPRPVLERPDVLVAL